MTWQPDGQSPWRIAGRHPVLYGIFIWLVFFGWIVLIGITGHKTPVIPDLRYVFGGQQPDDAGAGDIALTLGSAFVLPTIAAFVAGLRLRRRQTSTDDRDD